MNKQFLLVILKRFLKGLLAVVGAFALQFLLSLIPQLVQVLPSITSPAYVAVFSALLLALEKVLQGDTSQVNIPQ